MNVTQLVDRLKRCNPEAEVYVGICDDEWNVTGGLFPKAEELLEAGKSVQLTAWENVKDSQYNRKYNHNPGQQDLFSDFTACEQCRREVHMDTMVAYAVEGGPRGEPTQSLTFEQMDDLHGPDAYWCMPCHESHEARDRWTKLAETFPTLRNAEHVDPWDAVEFDRHMSAAGRRGSASFYAAQLVLMAYDPCRAWDVGSFNVGKALNKWDSDHRTAFKNWVSSLG